jgi:hypothetical protein
LPVKNSIGCQPKTAINTLLTILGHPFARGFWTLCARAGKPFIAFPDDGFFGSPISGVGHMPELDKVQPEEDFLVAFASTIVAALAVGLPMAAAIIWVCS